MSSSTPPAWTLGGEVVIIITVKDQWGSSFSRTSSTAPPSRLHLSRPCAAFDGVRAEAPAPAGPFHQNRPSSSLLCFHHSRCQTSVIPIVHIPLLHSQQARQECFPFFPFWLPGLASVGNPPPARTQNPSPARRSIALAGSSVSPEEGGKVMHLNCNYHNLATQVFPGSCLAEFLPPVDRQSGGSSATASNDMPVW